MHTCRVNYLCGCFVLLKKKKVKWNIQYFLFIYFFVVLVKGLAYYHFCSRTQAVHIISSRLFSHHKQMTNYKIHSTVASDCTSPQPASLHCCHCLCRLISHSTTLSSADLPSCSTYIFYFFLGLIHQ